MSSIEETSFLTMSPIEETPSLTLESITLRAKKLKELIENIQNLDEVLLPNCTKSNLELPDSRLKASFDKECAKSFAKINPSAKKFKCSSCSYKTNKRLYLNQHKLIHIEKKPYACLNCDYKTHMKGSLKQHLVTHVKSKQFSCHFCHYKANRKWNLTQHLLTHEDRSKCSEFSCDLCDYKTNIKSSFHKHLRNHSEGKKFKCPECDYKTYVKGTLRQHMMVHSKNKRYSCSHCEYRTNRNWSLKKHMKVHAEKEYCCRECNFRTTSKEDLKEHNTMFHYTNSKGETHYSLLSFKAKDDTGLKCADGQNNAGGQTSPSNQYLMNLNDEERVQVLTSTSKALIIHTEIKPQSLQAEYPSTNKKKFRTQFVLTDITSRKALSDSQDSLLPPVGFCKINISEKDNSAIAWHAIDS